MKATGPTSEEASPSPELREAGSPIKYVENSPGLVSNASRQSIPVVNKSGMQMMNSSKSQSNMRKSYMVTTTPTKFRELRDISPIGYASKASPPFRSFMKPTMVISKKLCQFTIMKKDGYRGLVKSMEC